MEFAVRTDLEWPAAMAARESSIPEQDEDGDEAHVGEVQEGARQVRKARAKLISGWCIAVMAVG